MGVRIVLIGAGSAQFGYRMLGDVFQSRVLEGSTVVLHDINQPAVQAVADVATGFVSEKKLPFSVEVEAERAAALAGADFVIISIDVGDRMQLWDIDRSIPRQFGSPQIYGENGGPGGVFHALRVIPPILDICGDIVRMCPDATVINFSNPMTAICTTVHRAYPALRFYGLCHEILAFHRQVPRILGVGRDAVEIVAGGLNHFSVLLAARYSDTGNDAYGDVLRLAPDFYGRVPGFSDVLRARRANPDTRWEDVAPTKPWADRGIVRFFIEQFGVVPITTDSHFGEYIGWADELADHRGIVDFLTWYADHLAHMRPEITLSLQERAVPIMEGIVTGAAYVEAAINVKNDGVFPQLPDFVAVEVPCRVGRGGIQPVTVPSLPPGIAALMRSYAGVYDLTAEAVLQRSRRLAKQAVLVSPVARCVSKVDELFEVMMDLQSEWLGYLQ